MREFRGKYTREAEDDEDSEGFWHTKLRKRHGQREPRDDEMDRKNRAIERERTFHKTLRKNNEDLEDRVEREF